MPYSIEEHRHRFAAWAACRAASVKGCRFKVYEGQEIIESSGLIEIGENISNLPSPYEFDDYHREWRCCIIQKAKNFQHSFTHGVAAKLINIYFKSIFVCCGDYTDPRIMAIHPPIDSVLLDALYSEDIGGIRKYWNIPRQIRWSNLSSNDYEFVIKCIKAVLPDNVGLWEIEEYWRGHQ